MTKKTKKPATGKTTRKVAKEDTVAPSVAAPSAVPAPVSAPPAKTLVLRTCPADMIARPKAGIAFQWPRQGPVECADWDPTPRCGGGLHGLAWGSGDWGLLSKDADAVWMVVEVETALLVSLDGGQKVKFPRGNVVFSGSQTEATIRVLCGAEAMSNARREAASWGEKYGYSSKAASSGYSSKAASSGESSKAASSGYSSTAASSGDYSTAACDGASGIAASIGNNGCAKAGANGLVIVTYWVEAERRYRACVGNVGENGIKADTWYKVQDGRMVEA